MRSWAWYGMCTDKRFTGVQVAAAGGAAMLEHQRAELDLTRARRALPASASSPTMVPWRCSRKRADRFPRLGVGDDLAVMEHDASLADAACVLGRVGDEDDGLPCPLEVLDAVDALALERLVAHRQDFVDAR